MRPATAPPAATRSGGLHLQALSPAILAAAVLAVDPIGLGGAVVRADATSAQAWADLAIALSGGEGPVRRLPLSVGLDRLCGGLDLGATLQSRRPVMQRGLLAEADGGWVAAPSAERLETSVAAELCAALDKGFIDLARDGLSHRSPARFALLALDDGRDVDERAPAALRERLALHVEPDSAALALPAAELAAQVALARVRLARVTLPPAAREALCGAAMAVGEPSLRAARFCTSVARILAALEGRPRVERAHVTAAAALVLASRARHLPDAPQSPEASEPQDSEPQASSPSDPSPPADDRSAPQTGPSQTGPSQTGPTQTGPTQTGPSQTGPSQTGPNQQAAPPEPSSPGPSSSEPSSSELADMTLAAVRAAALDGVFSSATGGAATASHGGGRVRGRAPRGRMSERGAPAGVRRPTSGAPRRLALVDTLKAAAPWQGLRAAQTPPSSSGDRNRVQVRPADFRVRVRKPPQRGAVVFVVDASGSAAMQRLAEAKGAVELLLADCYARRDQVALISFRKSVAEVVLPPTRSLTRVRRRLGEMAAGGATPLAHAITASGRLACAARERGEQPLLVFMSDARANVARSGEQGRAAGAADALAAGRELAGLKLDSVFIDISPRGEAQAGAVAQAMGARYLRLPHVQAEAIAQTVRAARDAVGGRA